jgi:hypothetical protein
MPTIALMLAACVLSLCLHSCFSDCKLYNTCPGALIEIAAENMSDETGEECAQCLKDHCRKEANTCSVDVACNHAARCRLATTPVRYQECLTELHDDGFSQGDEGRKPWEGEPKNAFVGCLKADCSSECEQDRFACGDVSNGAYGRLEILLAVRMFSDVGTSEEDGHFTVVKNAQARACSNTCPDKWTPPDENGQIRLSVENVEAASLYFELMPTDDSDDFPQTLYYPRKLGQAGLQLVAVYLVSKPDIEKGNAILGFGHGLLKEASQSFILPDGCIWENLAVSGLRLSAKSVETQRDVPQCHEMQIACSEGNCKPCIWYALTRVPTRTKQDTDETGAGIVGLAEGTYEVSARDESEHVVTRRTIRMVHGAMTIARTWPAN